jgi:hypothetical protein
MISIRLPQLRRKIFEFWWISDQYTHARIEYLWISLDASDHNSWWDMLVDEIWVKKRQSLSFFEIYWEIDLPIRRGWQWRCICTRYKMTIQIYVNWIFLLDFVGIFGQFRCYMLHAEDAWYLLRNNNEWSHNTNLRKQN